MTRMIANLLFAAGIGLATLLTAVQVPQSYVIVAVASVVLIAALSNCLRSRIQALIGLPGILYVYSRLIGQNTPGAELTLITAGFCIASLILILISDLASQPKGEDIRTHESA